MSQHETGNRNHQAVQARRGQGGPVGDRRAGDHRHRGQGFRPAEGPYRAVSRRRVRRRISAQGHDPSGDQGRLARPRDRGHREGGQHREDRRRQDLRFRPRTGRAYSHRRDRCGCTLRGTFMKRMLALIALVGVFSVSAPVVAQEKAPDQKAATPPAAAPAPAAPAPDAKAGEAPKADAAAAPAAAPPAPDTPQVIGVDKISSGDTAWMLSSTALVLLMTVPGLALFYGGMVRKKNVLATVMQSFAITCLVTVLWVVVGYSIAFTKGGPIIGSFERFFLNGMVFMNEAGKVSVSHLGLTIPESVYMTFQMTFAIITPALIAGAFADRMKFSAMLWFMGLWSVFVYAPIAHWVWGPGGFLNDAGILDFAGGTVVHINAGLGGLMAALVMGKRRGYRAEPMAPHNLVLSVIGASLLWVGWFGFNAGSATAANGAAGMAMTVTQIATATAALTWMFVEWALKGKPSVLGIISGAVAGLV